MRLVIENKLNFSNILTDIFVRRFEYILWGTCRRRHTHTHISGAT